MTTFLRPHVGLIRIVLLLAALFLLVGCAETGQMYEQPRYDTMDSSALFADGSSARAYVENTVPFTGQGTANDPVQTGQNASGEDFQGYPVQVTQELVQTGQERYAIFCTVCHGATGEGNGQATVYQFPKPPSLLSDQAKGLSNANIFKIIRDGQEVMFPYGYRVKAEERWAVIAYIRAMQLKNGAVNVQELTPEDITAIGGQQ